MAPYARTEVICIVLIGGLATVLVGWWAGWWALLPMAAAGALLAFYRDPPRQIPAMADALFAPADGLVTTADTVRDADGPQHRVVIFLSVLDVHVNRAPCAGRVDGVHYQPGEFLNALRADSTERNERNRLTLSPAAPIPGPVHVTQIAGVLARRIVCAVRPGMELKAGERYGMIKLGSRTELRFPETGQWNIDVRPGQKVYGGVTVIARLLKA